MIDFIITLMVIEELELEHVEDFKTIKKFTTSEVLHLLDTTAKEIEVAGYRVKLDNPRYALMVGNHKCVWCQTPSEIAYLRTQGSSRPGDYAIFTFHDKDDQLLYTKDHIMPRKRGGPNADWNYQNMCNRCNGQKGHGHPHSDRFARRHELYSIHEKETELWLRERFSH